jgi:hypothetical protein
MAKTPQEKISVKKWIFRIVLVVLGTPLLIGLIYLLYMYYNPQLRIDFKEFKPTTLPAGVSITGEELGVWTAHPLLWFAPYGIVVELHLNGEGSYISETKHTSKYGGTYSCSRPAIDEVCSNSRTPKGQDYTLLLTSSPLDPTKSSSPQDPLSSERIIFVKDDTYINIELSRPDHIAIPDTDIQTMIDSLTPTHFTHLQIKRYHPGP